MLLISFEQFKFSLYKKNKKYIKSKNIYDINNNNNNNNQYFIKSFKSFIIVEM